jgi:iron complex outermembrane receptor protein
VSKTVVLAALFWNSPVSAQVRHFEVPSSDASRAVLELARQARIDLVAPGKQLHGITTPAINGTYDVLAALELMLKGTDLVVSRSPEGVITISPRESIIREENEGMFSELKNSVSVVALAIGTITAISGSAHAQATSDQIETVVVTGFRASLASALEAKKNSNLFMESIVAEDIGKMPDQNVAESLQRLPGIQIARDQGKGTRVLINGLRQNLTTLNGDVFLTGKEFYVAGEASGGGAGANSQYASLEGIPSEEIGGVDIYKTPNAALSEGGMGGIINLKTRSPLDGPDGLSLTANLRGTFTSYSSSSNTTPNATLVASYKPSSTFAITGSVSYDVLDTHTKEYEAYNRSPWNITGADVTGYTGTGNLASHTVDPVKNPAFDATCPGPANAVVWHAGCVNPAANVALLSAGSYTALSGQGTLPGGKTYILPQYSYFSDVYDQNRTIGATLGANWDVSDSVQTSINWFYSHISDRNTTYSNKVGFNGSGSSSNVPGQAAPGINASAPYTIDGNGVVTSAQFWLQGAETATLLQTGGTDANNIQWHTNFDDGGPITATLDVSWAHATSSLKAAQQDIEHGYYTATGQSTSAALTAPGCNNFSPSCEVGAGNPAIPLQWTSGGDSGLPTAKYLAPYADVISNPAYTLFKSAWAWANSSKQDQEAVRGALVYKPAILAGIDGSITGGFRIAQRDVWQNFGRYLINGLTVSGHPIANCCYDPANGTYLYYEDPGYAAIPYDTAVSNPTLAKTVNNFMFGNMIVKNPVTGGMNDPATFYNAIWNNSHFVPAMVPATGTGNIPCANSAQAGCAVSPSATPNNSEKLFIDTLSSFKVHEATQAFYLMSDLGNKDKGFHANFGVRVVFTSQTIGGATSAPVVTSYGTATWNGINNNNIPFTASKNSVDILPSMNLALYPTDDQIIRLSAARVMSPADLFNLGVGQSYNFTRETGGRTAVSGPTAGTKDGFRFANGASGNPQLDPYRATQFNLSWEDYFAPEALASAGVFYKQIESFEVTQPVNTTVMDVFGGSAGPVNMPINGGHGSIYGLELSGQYVSDMGLGFAANYTYSQSTSALTTAFSQHLPIPDVSAHAATATVFYEKEGFDARVSYSWRSKAVNGGLGGATFSPIDTSTGNSKTFGVFTAPYGQLDAQVSYNFLDHFSVFVSGQNLAEEAYHTYMQYPNMPFTYDNSGARYFFGIKAQY